MKFNKLVAAGLLAAFLFSAVNTGAIENISAYEASTEEKAEKYRFLQESRAAAKEQKESFMQAVIDSVDSTESTTDDVDLQVYFDQLSETQAERVEAAKKAEREILLESLKQTHSGEGVQFVTQETQEAQQKQLIKAINKTSKSIEKAAKTVDKSAKKNESSNQTNQTSSSNTNLNTDADDSITQQWSSDDLAEVAICQAAGYNVLNEEDGCNSACRSYMAYTKVTSKTSAQYALLNSPDAYTDENTGIRMYQGRYCIALGQGYTKQIGTKVDLVLEDGTIWKCVLGECKALKDTDSRTDTYCKWDGSVAEFIIDNDYFNTKTERNPINTVLNNYGKIMKVVVID